MSRSLYKQIVRPFLFRLDPELAHHLTTALGQCLCSFPLLGKVLTHRYNGEWTILKQYLNGIRFPNPVGMAAGFDKNASLTHLLRATGFGYSEYGSITARPSEGNPQPRLFRATIDRGLINRMGLNNEGSETICRHITTIKKQNPFLFYNFPCGINIAKTHDPEITGKEAIKDYVTSYLYARQVADYITLNISCPNTREGKTFEESTTLSRLLESISKESNSDDPPLFIKFSPDIDLQQLEELVALCEQHRIHGYVLSNTSSRRDGLKTSKTSLEKIGAGGLSGALLFNKNLERITFVRALLPEEKIIIGCGGVDSPEKAATMLKAGANLLQLYTGFIYEGPSLIPDINDHLEEEMRKDGITSLKKWLRIHHRRTLRDIPSLDTSLV